MIYWVITLRNLLGVKNACHLRSAGFVRPLTAGINRYTQELTFGDGHHRLAAAMELRMETVPVLVAHDNHIAEDSGSWRLGDPVPEFDGYIL